MKDQGTLREPFALALAAFARESHPYSKARRLVDALEVLVKLHTVALVSDWVAREDSDAKVRTLLSEGLRTPTLGVWWLFAMETAKALRADSAGPFLAGLDDFVLDGDLANAMNGKDNFIALRNDIAHGTVPPDDVCVSYVQTYGPRLDRLAEEATALASARLRLAGPGDGIPAGHCLLERDDGVLLDLHPLLVYRDERHYFYNSIKDKYSATALNYVPYGRLKERWLREELLQRYPILEWGHKGSEAENFREKIESLAEGFQGRLKPLGKLMEFLERRRGFLMLWGPPGVGKSALVARAVQVLNWTPELRAQTYPKLKQVDVCLHTVPCFIRRGGGMDHASTLLDNLNQRLELLRPTGLNLGDDLQEKGNQLRARLSRIARDLKPNERLLLLVDGLDEGRDSEGLLESLPKEVPEGVLIVYASREQPRVRSAVWEALDREHREALDLGGLDPEDVRAVLHDSVDKYALQAEYLEEVVRLSKGNPLYLKLLCDGLESGTFNLNDQGSLPQSVKDIFSEVVNRIVSKEGTLDLLTLLAAAHAPMGEEAVAAALGRDLGAVSSTILPDCAEVLEDSSSASARESQLFHESLRDYLRERWPERVDAMEARLATWCNQWQGLTHRSKAYAMRHAVPHLLAAREAATARGEAAAAEDRLKEACALLDDPAWRGEVFLICGNAEPMQRAIASTQRALVRAHRTQSELPRIVAWALAYHGEGQRLYAAQLARLEALGRDAEGSGLEPVADLAAMGLSPRDRVLLALRALRARSGPRSIPPALDRIVRTWLEEARNPALEALWDLEGGASKPDSGVH